MFPPNERLHFEDFPPGHTMEYGAYRVTKDEIIDFASRYDPQPVHLDEAAARSHMLGGLCASGWHTCAMLMRMNCDGFLLRSTSLGGPGITEVRWLKPVRPGDVLRVRQKILGARASRSRPEMGLTECFHEVLAQDDATVMTMRSTIMFKRRHADVAVPPAEAKPVPEPVDPPTQAPPVAAAGEDASIACYLDDIVIGSQRTLGSYTFEKDDVVGFASRYDCQPFHVDEEAARSSFYGRMIASGWHTAGCWMGSFVRHYRAEVEQLVARGKSVPAAGPSPGFRDLRWPKPTYVDDTLHFTSQIVDKRPSLTRPRWGLLFSRNKAVNQHGELVYEFSSSAFWPRRP